MKYFLDTNVIIDAVKGKNQSVMKHFLQIYASDIYVSSVVAAELEYGAVHSNDYAKNKFLYENFIKNFPIVSFEKSHSHFYAQIREQLGKSGKPIGSNDMLIAATTMANGGILVTHNTREFSRVNGLVIEDWTVAD